MDKTQFIISIITNIVAAIIMWTAVRFTRGAKNIFTSGTVQENVKRVFNIKRINILGGLIAALINLWILIKFIAGRSSFTRLELFSGMIFSLITFYWANRLVAGLRSTTERRLDETQQLLGEARQQADETGQRLSETQTRLEEERNTRLGLEKSLAPRVIKPMFDGGGPNFDGLKPFAGTQVIIESFPEAEPMRAAAHILELLRAARWNILKFGAVTELGGELNFDGVIISAYVGENSERDSSDNAADELVAWLKNNNIEAMRFPSLKGKLSPNTVRVLVGMKPDPYFRSEAQERMREKIEEIERRMRKGNKI